MYQLVEKRTFFSFSFFFLGGGGITPWCTSCFCRERSNEFVQPSILSCFLSFFIFFFSKTLGVVGIGNHLGILIKLSLCIFCFLCHSINLNISFYFNFETSDPSKLQAKDISVWEIKELDPHESSGLVAWEQVKIPWFDNHGKFDTMLKQISYTWGDTIWQDFHLKKLDTRWVLYIEDQ